MEYSKTNDPELRHGNHLPMSRNCLMKVQSNGLLYDQAKTRDLSLPPNQLQHSNSSIELYQVLRGGGQGLPSSGADLRRTVNHGPSSMSSSSDGRTNDSFFAMLQDYQPAVMNIIGTDQRSPGPAEFMQERVVHATPFVNDGPDTNVNQTEANNSSMKKPRDPKVKKKLHRFLAQTKSKPDDVAPILSNLSLTKNTSLSEDLTSQYYPTTTHRTAISFAEMEEQQRQRVFAHYDCQSLAAHLNYVKKLRGLSARTASGTNGDSSGSSLNSTKSCNGLVSDDKSHCNSLLRKCPYFYNEVGDNNEQFAGVHGNKLNSFVTRTGYKTPNSNHVSILESLPNETLWRVGACPFQNDSYPIESADYGAHYYRRFFHTQKHENWFGIDEQLGPLAISIKRERVNDNVNEQRHHQHRYQFRMIIRTSELLTLRGIVLEESIINPRGSNKSVSSKELLEHVAPEIQISCLRLGVSTSNCEEQLQKLDEQGLTSRYKVGILYCRSGQSSEEDMYNNENAGPAFMEFLEAIGKRVRLKGFQQYKAGLDNKTDSTGTHSLYTKYKECEIMFHVSTMLPFTPNNRQQLLRKRHIGNDIVTIVFQEPGALPFSPENIRSQFQHVFVVVRAINPCTDNPTYRVAISRSKEVPAFGPSLQAGGLFLRNKAFTDFILAKIINAENAAHRSEKFANLATRTRREYLKDLCTNYCTNIYMDPGNKFSIFPSKKKDKAKVRFSGHISQRGAICWQIMFHHQGLEAECCLGISAETFVIMEETSKQVIFATPTRSILGWYTSDNSLRIFYHNGECITISMRCFGGLDEQLEVIERLQAVTLGNGATELSIRRNMIVQLGFHVQPDGIVTQVEPTGQAWAAGLRRGCRLVEICKIVVASLSHSEMIDLLKTSAQLTFIVIKSFPDGTPRRGCFNKYCKTNFLSVEDDYEFHRFSNSSLETDSVKARSLIRNEAVPKPQHPVVTSRNRYEQNSLPHKSSKSDYYAPTCTLLPKETRDDYNKTVYTSDSSSPHSCQNGHWYDLVEDTEHKQNTQNAIHSLNQRYAAKSYDHSKLEESTSLPLNLNARFTLPNDSLRTQTYTVNGKPNFSQHSLLPSTEMSLKKSSDNYKLLKHRYSKIDVPDKKYTTSSLNEPRGPESSKQTYYLFEEKINHDPTYHTPVFKADHEVNLRGSISASSSPVKTAKLLPSSANFNSMNSIPRDPSSYSKSTSYRRDLLDVLNPASFSQYDESSTSKRNSTVERNTSTHDQKQVAGIQPTFKNATDGAQISFNLSRSATILSQRNTDDQFRKHNPGGESSLQRLKESMESMRRDVRNDIPTAPALLPDTKDLDWSTLVDTATKAITLQDDCSCKF